MELRHLRYFVVVAEEENITRAASRLHVSQPALSRQIRDLEDELDLLLFRRSAKTVRLTPAGRVFLGEARAVLERAETAIKNVHAVAAGLQGEIHVGYSPSLTVQILPRALRKFQEEFPGVRVVLHDFSTGEMIAGLRDGSLHLALTVQLRDPQLRGLEIADIESYDMNVAMRPDHPLAHLAAITLPQLASERLVGYTRENYPEYHEFLIELLAPTGRKPQVVEAHDSVSSLLAAVEAARGVALMPSCVSCMTGPRIRLLAIDPPPSKVPVCAIYPAGIPSLIVKNFIAAAVSMPR